MAETTGDPAPHPAKIRATGWINVTSIGSHPFDQADGLDLSELDVIEEFTGDLRGTGKVRFVMLKWPDGAAYFTGIERFTGTLAELTGSFIFHNWGTRDNGEVIAQWHVIPGSGTGELAGLRGEGGCSTATGIFLDYWFE